MQNEKTVTELMGILYTMNMQSGHLLEILANVVYLGHSVDKTKQAQATRIMEGLITSNEQLLSFKEYVEKLEE